MDVGVAPVDTDAIPVIDWRPPHAGRQAPLTPDATIIAGALGCKFRDGAVHGGFFRHCGGF